MLDSSLGDIFRTSEEICQRKQLRESATQAGPDMYAFSTKTLAKKTFERSYDQRTQPMANYNLTSSEMLDASVKESIERSRIEAERAFFNQQILEATQLAPLREKSNKLTGGSFNASQVFALWR